MGTLGEFSARSLDGTDVDLSAYDGKVVLVVNTASSCGYAAQLPGLQRLHDEFGPGDFSVLGFPSNQFKQEPLADGEIGSVCQRNYGVTFPMFEKIDVNGAAAHPLYQWLRKEKGGVIGNKIRWNFTKFLVSKDGKVLQRYSPSTSPSKISADIEKALAA